MGLELTIMGTDGAAPRERSDRMTSNQFPCDDGSYVVASVPYTNRNILIDKK